MDSSFYNYGNVNIDKIMYVSTHKAMAVWSMRISDTGNENSSLEYALFKSRKSPHAYLSFLLLHWNTTGHPIGIFFFLYETSLIELFCLDDNLFFKLSILIGRGACLKGCTFGSILIWLSNTESIYNKIESYDFLYPIISIQILSFAQKMKI